MGKPAKDIPTGVSDKGVALKACVSDKFGNCAQTISPQAIVTFEGETAAAGFKYVTIFSDITNIGDVDVIVTDISSPETHYQQGITNRPYLIDYTLSPLQTDSQQATFDATDVALITGSYIEFRMDVEAYYYGAEGPAGGQLDASTFGTVNILFETDVCTDNTPWGTCSGSKPQFCEPGQLYESVEIPYIQGELVDKASVCGCPVDYIIDPSNPNSCILNACTDGTIVGQCKSPVPGDTNIRYCDNTRTMVEACGICGCMNDYYGFSSTGCDANDLCEYAVYTGGLDVTVGGSDSGGSPATTCTSGGYITCTNAVTVNSYAADGKWMVLDNSQGYVFDYEYPEANPASFGALLGYTWEGYPIYEYYNGGVIINYGLNTVYTFDQPDGSIHCGLCD